MTINLDLGHAFMHLHQADRGFLMPNAWDAGSAIVLAAEGFAAIGTTSAGIAFSLGKPDHSACDARFTATRQEALDRLKQVVASVRVPVNADLESGYGETPEAVAETVRMAIDAGAAGANIEDVNPATGELYDIATAAQRIAASREAIVASGRVFVLNARTDAMMGGGGVELAIERANRLVQAGAHCIFVPGVTDERNARRLVQGIKAPLNLVIGLNEAGSGARALLDAGVKRVSVGGSIARAALGLVRRAARELREAGTVSYAADQISQSELNQMFERALLNRSA